MPQNVRIHEAPAEINPSGLVFLSAFALHRGTTEELYFITLVLISTACSPSRGNLVGGGSRTAPTAQSI